MALTRKMLKAMGIEEEKIDQIIEAHSETVDALKSERDEMKDKVSKYADIQKKLDEANEKLSKAGDDTYKAKYDALKAEFDSYKTDITAKETKAAKTAAYTELLKKAGVSEQSINAIIKVSNLDDIEIGDDGKVKNAAKVTESIKTEWSGFIGNNTEKGIKTPNPPANNGGKAAMTKSEIMAIKDTAERRAKIAENPELFGLQTNNND